MSQELTSGPVGQREPPAVTAGDRVLWLFTATMFLSALLLFSVQPMFAKMVLPILGGAPSVWAVALCFFQGALLAGYAYAHVLNRRLDVARAGFVHLGLALAALLTLPIAIPRWWGEPPPGEPYLWQLGLFAVAIGLPFVAVAANAPLLQAWFARSGHAQSKDPYFLYAASNLGSLLALLAYPLVLEPAFGVSALARFWTAGFVVLGLAIAACAWTVRDRVALTDASPAPGESAGDPADADHPTTTQRLGWIGLSLVPSALLTAFTTHVSTDIASAPLIWVVPLALYLLTFVLVFRERPLIPMPVLLILHMVAVVVALLQLSQTRHENAFLAGGYGVAAFFLAALVAHRTLYEARPASRHLTEFYLWMSLGGVLGGLFAALLAPRLFSEVFEYPLLLALSIACRPGAIPRGLDDKDEWLRMWLVAAGCILALFWLPWLVRYFGISTRGYGVAFWLVAIFAIVLVAHWRQPPRQLVAALMMFAVVSTLPSGVKRGDAQRSYFGVYRVAESYDGEYNILTHGTTLHGAQRVRDAAGDLVVDTTPATYYHPKSPMARSVEIVRAMLAETGRTGRYGIVGLGAGSLSCYAKPDESWRFFEIDPTVVAIATNPEKFSFLHNCLPSPDIVIGDARLTIAKEPDARFDLLIVDAFSSDAVPVHLMTAEALRLYAAKLTPTGVVVLHISNRYLDLDAVVAATAGIVSELDGVIVSDDTSDGSYASSTSTIAALSRSPDTVARFHGSGSEVRQLDAKSLRAWTDDYSDVLGPVLSRMH